MFDLDGDGIFDGVDFCRNLVYEVENFLEGNIIVYNYIFYFYGDGFVDYINDIMEFIFLLVEMSIGGEY